MKYSGAMSEKLMNIPNEGDMSEDMGGEMGGELVAAEDIKAGETIEIKDGMAYCKYKEDKSEGLEAEEEVSTEE